MKTKLKKPRPIKTIVIDRKRWGSGSLRNYPDGTQCCLGFCARLAGYKSAEIVCRADGTQLEDVQHDIRFQTGKKRFVWMATAFSSAFPSLTANRQIVAATINDSDELTWAEKERKLTAAFKRWGLRLVFKGKPKDPT